MSETVKESVCRAICDNWPKTPDGCAAACWQRLGSIPKEGCAYRAEVHGKMAMAILTTLFPDKP